MDLPSDTELLLDGDFMRDVLQRYSVQQAEGAAAAPLVAPHFPLKHLNIVDPLLPSNNLGRSVSKASYARVKKALLLGSRTLEEALLKVGGGVWCSCMVRMVCGCSSCFHDAFLGRREGQGQGHLPC